MPCNHDRSFILKHHGAAIGKEVRYLFLRPSFARIRAMQCLAVIAAKDLCVILFDNSMKLLGAFDSSSCELYFLRALLSG